MNLNPPNSYSPSSISQFISCPLAYRYSYIEKRPREPSLAATKGSIVHRALELLFENSPTNRDLKTALENLDIAFLEYSTNPDLTGLELSDDQLSALKKSSIKLIHNYFDIEDPTTIKTIGLELKLEAEVKGNTVRGIIDRLDIDENGDLIVIDYKTGSVPYKQMENSKMDPMHIYSLLCQSIFGKLPVQVQLIYISKPVTIIGTPTPNSIKAIENKTNAISIAVKTAVKNNDFRPKVSRLCEWCSYHELCPEKGGVIPT